jgi:uncharacterized membrane protein
MKYLILFFLYSFFGVGVEVFFTSIGDTFKNKDLAFRGKSYLWMFPIYGSWGLVIGPLYHLMGSIPFILRGFIYVFVIIAGEFIYGSILKLAIKKCPWEYKTKWTLKGFVNFTFIPFWLIFGYLSELLYRGFILITIF